MSLLAVLWIVLHSPDGLPVEVNADLLIALKEPREAGRHFPANVGCVLQTSVSLLPVTESCITVRTEIGRPIGAPP